MIVLLTFQAQKRSSPHLYFWPLDLQGRHSQSSVRELRFEIACLRKLGKQNLFCLLNLHQVQLFGEVLYKLSYYHYVLGVDWISKGLYFVKQIYNSFIHSIMSTKVKWNTGLLHERKYDIFISWTWFSGENDSQNSKSNTYNELAVILTILIFVWVFWMLTQSTGWFTRRPLLYSLLWSLDKDICIERLPSLSPWDLLCTVTAGEKRKQWMEVILKAFKLLICCQSR